MVFIFNRRWLVNYVLLLTVSMFVWLSHDVYAGKGGSIFARGKGVQAEFDKVVRVELIQPAFNVPGEKLVLKLEEMIARGFLFTSSLPDNISVEERRVALVQALTDSDCKNLLCARGGYGTSDLLPHIPYDELNSPKRVIGYSDISALHSALWTKNGFVGISGAMLGANTWNDLDSEEMQILLGIMADEITSGEIEVKPLSDNSPADDTTPDSSAVEGTLFGGNISVLTNLIATPYMPESLAGYILFFEDVGENVFRVMRYLNQWQQSGMLDGVKAIVLGRFDGLIGEESDLHAGFKARVNFPVYVTDTFGHGQPLYPLPIGGQAKIVENKLSWRLPE